MIMQWKTIISYEDYEISNYGHVRRKEKIDRRGHKRKMKYLKQNESNHSSGTYYRVFLYSIKGATPLSVHRLVCSSFNKKVKGKNFVNHIDGDKHNNRSDNLEWCTSSENHQHAIKMGLQLSGSNHPNSKLTDDDVMFIRDNYEKRSKTLARKDILKKYNISAAIYHRVINRETYNA